MRSQPSRNDAAGRRGAGSSPGSPTSPAARARRPRGRRARCRCRGRTPAARARGRGRPSRASRRAPSPVGVRGEPLGSSAPRSTESTPTPDARHRERDGQRGLGHPVDAERRRGVEPVGRPRLAVNASTAAGSIGSAPLSARRDRPEVDAVEPRLQGPGREHVGRSWVPQVIVPGEVGSVQCIQLPGPARKSWGDAMARSKPVVIGVIQQPDEPHVVVEREPRHAGVLGGDARALDHRVDVRHEGSGAGASRPSGPTSSRS